MKTESIIQNKSFELALKIVGECKKMQSQNEFVLSKQLLRSGTSVGANVSEATAAYSKKDFVHKMSIASKEARETEYWIRLIEKSGLGEEMSLTLPKNEVEQVISILTKIVKTGQENLVRRNSTHN